MTPTPKKVEKVSDADAMLDAIKTLTTTVADLASKINEMKQTHDKWVAAGRF